MNYAVWPEIIDTAKKIGLDKISFLPADVSSNAFNREISWDAQRQHEILIPENELPKLESIVKKICKEYAREIDHDFIVESAEKLNKIYLHYAAVYGHTEFPYKKCNAPWVSTVVEADGTVRPCFFHEPYGNLKNGSLDEIINSENAIRFRKELDMAKNATCLKCVCYLNLRPSANL